MAGLEYCRLPSFLHAEVGNFLFRYHHWKSAQSGSRALYRLESLFISFLRSITVTIQRRSYHRMSQAMVWKTRGYQKICKLPKLRSVLQLSLAGFCTNLFLLGWYRFFRFKRNISRPLRDVPSRAKSGPKAASRYHRHWQGVFPIFFELGSLRSLRFIGNFLKQTDDQYSAVWGANSMILGRVRLADGLIILGQTSHVRLIKKPLFALGKRCWCRFHLAVGLREWDWSPDAQRIWYRASFTTASELLTGSYSDVFWKLCWKDERIYPRMQTTMLGRGVQPE